MFTQSYLAEIRGLALRKRVFYRVLDRVERGILSLSCRVIDVVADGLLADQLSIIVEKISEACVSAFRRMVERFGVPRVKQVVRLSLDLGGEPSGWLTAGFAEYLAFLNYNQPGGWRIDAT